MAMPETVAEGACDRCKRPVDAKINSGGFAYYMCGCGWSGRAHNASGSRKYLAEIGAGNSQEKAALPEVVEPAAQAGNLQEKAAPEVPEKKKPAKGSLAELMGA